jgi:hypothetical protein
LPSDPSGLFESSAQQLYAFARCPTIILVVVRAIAVPVIRDGEGGVLKHPVLSGQAQQAFVSGVWQIAIFAVERLRLEGAPGRIPGGAGVPAGHDRR